MTEIDAAQVGELDAHSSLSHHATLRGPEDVPALFETFLVHRAQSLDRGSDLHEPGTVATQLQALFRYPVPGATPSRRIAGTVEEILRTCLARSPGILYEDARALFAWIGGDPTTGEGGFIPLFFRYLPDAESEAMTRHITGQCAAAQAASLRADQAFLEATWPYLGRADRARIRGLVLDATWARQDGDGESARHAAIQARSLARTLAARRKRAQVFERSRAPR